MAEFGGARPVGTFAGHRDGVTFIDSRGDDRYLLTNSKDQTIKLWDMRCFASDEAIVRMVSARNAIQFPVQEATKNAVRGQKWDYRWQCCPPENYNSNPLPGSFAKGTRGCLLKAFRRRVSAHPTWPLGASYSDKGTFLARPYGQALRLHRLCARRLQR